MWSYWPVTFQGLRWGSLEQPSWFCVKSVMCWSPGMYVDSPVKAWARFYEISQRISSLLSCCFKVRPAQVLPPSFTRERNRSEEPSYCVTSNIFSKTPTQRCSVFVHCHIICSPGLRERCVLTGMNGVWIWILIINMEVLQALHFSVLTSKHSDLECPSDPQSIKVHWWVTTPKSIVCLAAPCTGTALCCFATLQPLWLVVVWEMFFPWWVAAGRQAVVGPHEKMLSATLFLLYDSCLLFVRQGKTKTDAKYEAGKAVEQNFHPQTRRLCLSLCLNYAASLLGADFPEQENVTSGSITVMLIFCPQWEFKALGVLSQQFPCLSVQASEGLSENFLWSWHCVSF